jgi:hypothetical protein
MDYLDFEVEIGPGVEGEYPVRVLHSPAGEASGSMHLPFAAGAIEARLAAVQATLLRSSAIRRGPTSSAAHAVGTDEPSPDLPVLGRELFGSLFDSSMRTLLRSSQEAADDRKWGLRIKLRIEAPELAMLPWEFLYDPERDDYVSLASSRPLVRYISLDAPSDPLAIARPLRILGVIASPPGLRPLNVERERQRLERAVDALRGRGDVDLVWLGGQSARYLQAALRDGPWHVLHFVGHGGYDKAAGQGFVVLVNDEGGPKLLYARDLAHLVDDHHDLRLVVLNACDGARGNEVDLFSSSASFLVRHGTPAVVAMQFEITDQAAIEFSRSFYEAIADGAPIDTALGEARKSMSIANQRSLEWGTPVLYTHAADGRLFDVKRVTRRARARRTPVAAGTEVAIVFDAAEGEPVAALARLLEGERRLETTLVSLGDGSTAATGEIATLESALAVVIVAGPTGLTVLDHPTVSRTLARRSHDQAFRIAPVLMPGSGLPDLGQLPEFLAGRHWVDLRGGIATSPQMDELVGAVLGTDAPVTPAEGHGNDPPFRGLQVFEEEHADNFFGREALTQQLVERLRTHRFLALLGPSGSGKSSVVRAGLVPELRHDAIPGSGAWPIVVLKPGAHPLAALATALAQVAGDEAVGLASDDSILTALLHDTEGLHRAVQSGLTGSPDSRRIAVVIDQFEEVFTLCHDEAERDRFISLLLAASTTPEGRTVIVLTMRADFMGRTTAYPALAASIAEHVVLVTPMTREELRRAIVMPARRAGLQVEESLVETILAELGGEAGALPLLEDTLLELWQGRSGGWLTMERYQRIGGVRGALEQRADALYDSLPENQQQIARQILLGLVELGSGVEITRRRARLREFSWSRPGMDPAEVGVVIQKMVDARLVTVGSDDAGETIDVAHEALINNWATLQGWIEVYGAGVRLHRALAEEARRWQSGGQDPSDLRRGRRLTEATNWSRETLDDISDVQAFLDASVAAEEAAERARLEAESERRRVRRRQVRTVIGLGAALIVVLATGAGISAWLAVRAEDARADALDAQHEAEHAQLVAQAQAKSAQGVATAVTKPLPGLADALEGWALASQAGISTSGYRDAVEALIGSGRIAAIGEGVERLIRSPDGQHVVVDFAAAPGAVVRLSDGLRIASLAGEVAGVTPGPQNAGVFGIDYVDAPGELRQWATGTPVALGMGSPAFHFPLDPNGQVVIVGYSPDPDMETGGIDAVETSPAEVRSITDGQLVRQLAAAATEIQVLPSTDGDRALIGLGDHTEILRMTDGSTVASINGGCGRRPAGGSATICATSAGPGSSCAIFRTSDGTTISARPRWSTHGAFIDGCGVVSTSPDGAWAAVALRHRVALIDVSDLTTKPRWSTKDDIIHVAIPPGGEPSSVLAFTTHSATLWRIGDAEPVATLSGQLEDTDYSTPPVSFSPDGAFAVFELDRELMIVRMSDGAVIPTPFESVDPEIPVATRIEFAVGANGAVAHVFTSDGNEYAALPDVPIGHLTKGRVQFWPGGGGPVIAEHWDEAFGLPSVSISGFSDVLFGPNADPTLGVVRFQVEEPETSAEPVQPALVVYRDGTTATLRTSVDAVDFAQGATTSVIVVRYSDERSEIWDTVTRRVIGVLGLGVGSNVFDVAAQRLAVRYLAGDTYLVDIQRLRKVPADLTSLSDADLQALACRTLGGSAASWAPTACH